MRSIAWRDDHIEIVDQTALPHELRHLRLRTTDDVVDAIRRLAIRGAPAIGVCGALGVALAARRAATEGRDTAWVREQAARIAAARPTAVNLRWAVERVLPALPDGPQAVLDAALEMLEEDVAANAALARRGADLVARLVPAATVAVHTHCNTGDLATVEIGTALGVVRELHARGRLREVLVDETRPLLQGARLTAFELGEHGVPYRIVVDGAGPYVIASGMVDVVIVGADRVAANGDVANKVGTYGLALAAQRAGVPFLVAAPESTLDPATPSGAAIHIEERDPREVLSWGGVTAAPAGAAALNLAFDVTPAELVTAIVTERRVIRPGAGEHPTEEAPAAHRAG